MEGRDQPDAGHQGQQLRQPLAEGRAQAVEQRLARRAELEAAGRDRGIEPQDEAGGDEKGEQARDDAARHVAARIHRLLGGQRQLLDGEEQPDREGQGGERALQAERQQRAVALGQFDRPAGGVGADVQRIASEFRDGEGGDPEDGEAGQGGQGHDHRDAEGKLDTPHVQPDEHAVARDPVERQPCDGRVEHGGEIGREEGNHDGGRQHVLDVLAQAGDEAAPWAHRGAGEGIGASGMRQGGAHLGDAEDQAEIHDGDHARGQRQAAPAAGQQAEVPAGIVAGDDGADPQGPQRGDAGIAAQAAAGEIVGGDLTVGIGLGSHVVTINL